MRKLGDLASSTGKDFVQLTEAVIDATQSTNPTKLDFASWPSISGDHSCSGKNMLHNVLETGWILKVADITAQLKIDIVKARDRGERINALRKSDLELQSADPEYATRAGSKWQQSRSCQYRSRIKQCAFSFTINRPIN